MSVPTDPGGGGDPYITRLDGSVYEFTGEPGRIYDLYSRGELRVLPRVCPVPDQPGRSYFCGLDVLLPGGSRLVLGTDGLAHVFTGDGQYIKVETKACTLDAPGHAGCTSEEPHPLMGVPHLNVVLGHPGALSEGATGLTVDGGPGCDPAAYEVPEATIVGGGPNLIDAP